MAFTHYFVCRIPVSGVAIVSAIGDLAPTQKRSLPASNKPDSGPRAKITLFSGYMYLSSAVIPSVKIRDKAYSAQIPQTKLLLQRRN